MGEGSTESADKFSTRTMQNVCSVWKELTSIEEHPSKVAGLLMPYIRDFKWEVYDFRLIIEFSLKDKETRAFLDQPMRMSLKTIFHAGRGDRVYDIWNQLKNSEKIRERLKAFDDDGRGPTRLPQILMHCGAKIAVGDKEGYDGHMIECFEAKGKCFT